MIQKLVENYRQAEEELFACDFSAALRRHLQAMHERGEHLSWVGVNKELEDYVDWVFRFTNFGLASYQRDPAGLVVEYAHRDEPYDLLGTTTIPWACFAEEGSAVAAVSQGNSSPSPIHAKLVEYVSSRGIPMPVYHDGSKITEEAGELRDALRAHLAQPSASTLAHLQEEVADVTIVAAVAAQQFDFTVEAALTAKIAKDSGRGPKRCES